LSFIFGKKGGVDKWTTLKKMKLIKLVKDIYQLPLEQYDLVINDFEPISAWACLLHRKKAISLSHQNAILHANSIQPVSKDWFGKLILKYYAPASKLFGFHFEAIGTNIFTPIIQKKIRASSPSDKGHYTVYLPSYDDNTLVKELSIFENIQWEVFSKHCTDGFSFKNIHIQPIINEGFINSLVHSKGVLCGAGFETPAEALYLGKKLMVIPMASQYEQQCNAAFLESMNIPVIDSLSKKNRTLIAEWIENGSAITINYPDNTNHIVEQIVEAYWSSEKHFYSIP
jgi:uncharacterized protein (TIGR00661 family)